MNFSKISFCRQDCSASGGENHRQVKVDFLLLSLQTNKSDKNLEKSGEPVAAIAYLTKPVAIERKTSHHFLFF